ncbi:hypothetical protein G7046_g8589 [Stylonectria norvegica]|nr:hypothetical protein G7046_g8589 [Stylonectria norvegica]
MTDITNTGSCLCGAISFTLHGDPTKGLTCYCSHCSKNAGGLCQIMAAFLSSNISISDPGKQLRIYVITDGVQGGFPKEKHFCGTCGCMLWTVPMKYEGNTRMVRTSLVEDGLTKFLPTLEIFKN